MARNTLLLTLVAVILLMLCQRQVQASDSRLDAPTIKAALRTTDMEEEGFVERVVEMMDGGELPRKIVHSAFLWAKRKPKNRFQYFKRAVIVLAARQGITVS
ncbi:MAG: hypothetical protein JW809_15405 [Pirellulales bacterium]|nr:hypothetical protein [Pirellulales bacterium]